MATKKKKISELTPATSLVGLWSIGVDADNNSVKVNLSWLKESADNLTVIKTNAEKATTAANKAASDANNTMTRISQDVKGIHFSYDDGKIYVNMPESTTANNTEI